MKADEALRQSGEDTARHAERLRTASENRPAIARDLLMASAAHIHHLEAAGMGPDAVATGVMTLLTVLHHRINPEDIDDVYTAYLQDLFLLSLRVCQGGCPDEDAASHLMEICMRLGALCMATFHTLECKIAEVKVLAERNTAIETMFAGAPVDFYTFQDKPIIAQSAIDILSDAAARLASIGLVE